MSRIRQYTAEDIANIQRAANEYPVAVRHADGKMTLRSGTLRERGSTEDCTCCDTTEEASA